jgi:hypothetical protein
MTDHGQATADSATPSPHDEQSPPRSDLKDAAGWILLGIATVIGSWRMDRLESQNINPYTVPGLLPGLLGLAMVLLGAIMAIRSWQRGALTQPLAPPNQDTREGNKRVWIAIAMCCGYGIVLVGHGIPFWIASSIYVTACILVFQRLSRDPVERQLTARAWSKAIVIGVLASVITWLVFERVFLVRLP